MGIDETWNDQTVAGIVRRRVDGRKGAWRADLGNLSVFDQQIPIIGFA